MKKIIVVLHRLLDEPVGRNEKIKSRIKILEDNGWIVEVKSLKLNNYFSGIFKIFNFFFAFLNICSDIRKEIKNSSPTVIWTMNAPSYLHLIGLFFKIFYPRLKWVAEFRDALCEEPFFSRKGLYTRILNRIFEGPILYFVDRVVLIMGGQTSYARYKNLYPKLVGKVEEITYIGFDDDYRNLDESFCFDKFTITYAGSFYKNWIEPIDFFIAFSDFINKNNISPKQIQINFYSKGFEEEYHQYLDNLGLDEYVNINGFIEKERILSILRGSDLLLYIGGGSQGISSMVLSKFWDYIASDSLILALVDEEYTIHDIIKKNMLGYVAGEKDTKGIVQALESAFFSSKEDVIKMIDKKRFSRRVHDEEFVDIINKLIL